MADVRSMLRAQREARKVDHPNASYTSNGKLLCNLCETIVKSEAAWPTHLQSARHTLRIKRAQEAAASRIENGGNRKRKVSAQEDRTPSPDNRKKTRPAHDFVPEKEVESRSKDSDAGPVTDGQKRPVEVVQSSTNLDAAADPTELAAFERELQELEASMSQSRAMQAGVTIAAAPMTAEELAAQAREEQSTQRGRRDAELEAEREDAARILEEEFEEMEGLEARAKKLRAKREALRNTPHNGSEADQPTRQDFQESAQLVVESDAESDEDTEYDDWNFGRS